MSVERICLDKIQKLEQENKQLKEELYSSRTFLADSQKHCEDLDNKHEEYRKYQKELIDSWEAKANKLNPLIEENKQLKEELNELLNDPDFGHMKNCGICGELVSKAIDEISCINVKSSRLTWVCKDCDNLKQNLEQIKELTKDWVVVSSDQINKLNKLLDGDSTS